MMKKRWVATAGIVLATTTSSAVAAVGHEWWSGVRSYVGADAQVRRMDFKGGYGDNLLQHHSPQGNLYGGLKFTPTLGVEFGYEATTTRTRTATLTTGDISNGATISEMISPAVFKSKQKIKGPHVDLVGYYSFYEDSPFQLVGSIGAAVLKATFERKTLSLHGVPSTIVRKLSLHKTVLRLMGGLQYGLSENLGARFSLGWVNTSRMVIYATDGMPSPYTPAVKPKNSFVYGIGMLWTF